MKSRRRCQTALAALFCLAGLAAGVAACSEHESADPRPVVVVSVLPQKFVVDRIAGDRVRVEVMIPPAANPSTHQPTLLELRALSEAAVYVKVGHPAFAFERAWLNALLEERPGLPIVDGSAGLDRAGDDPHVWVAPRQLERMAIDIEAALARLLPEVGPELDANLSAFRAEIDTLDAELRQTLSRRPSRVFFVFHPAWGHFARAYGLEQVAIEHGHKPPDARRIQQVVERARAENARVVFAQPQFDPAAARTVAHEIGARVVAVDPLAYDWATNLREFARVLTQGPPT
jgi:zinc transport system substrate-binding protein